METPKSPRDMTGGLAQIGYGFGQWGLAWMIFSNVHAVSLQALPEAVTGWSIFLSMVSFWMVFYLYVSGAYSVLAGVVGLVGGHRPKMLHCPFWTDGFRLFWTRWGTWSAEQQPPPTIRAALTRASLVWVAVILHSGFRPVMVTWLVLQALLILLDDQLGRIAWWRDRLPFWIKSVLIAVLFLLSSVLLFSEDFQGVWWRLQGLFHLPAQSLYALFLDARLTTPQLCWSLWLGVIIILVLPDFSWWMSQRARLRRLAKAGGFLTAGLLVFLGLPKMTPSSGVVVAAAQRFALWLFPDGSAHVRRGADGWLYPQEELDRLTQKRRKPGLEADVLMLQTQLKSSGTRLLVIPVPGKISLRPEPILPAKYSGAVYPPGYHDSLKRLKEAGVDVLDMTDKLWDRRNLMPLYFQQDSHWRWEAMKELTVQVSRHIRQKYPEVVKDETPLIDAAFMERHDIGDLAKGLTFGSAEHLWKAESTQMVGLRGLSDRSHPWGDGRSPVLVVGSDDLVRVYDDASQSFPPVSEADAPAAFPTQLGALLGRSLDVIFVFDSVRLLDQAWDKKLVIWVMRAGDL